jgi:hypothetical protein
MAHLAPRSPRDRLMVALIVGAVLEILWTIYLAWQLPRHYVAYHWDLAWVGVDVAEVVLLLASAWAAWRRLAILIPLVVSSATLLLLDAWFDVTTAGHGDLDTSVLVALLLELPSALLLLWIARRATRHLIEAHFGDSEFISLPVRQMPLYPKRDD